MKATITTENQPPQFKPVTIAITFETQHELNLFGALFNSGGLNGKINHIKTLPLWNIANNAGANLDKTSELVCDKL